MEDKVLPLKAISVPSLANRTLEGLVIALHGWGANAQDMLPMVDALQQPNYRYLLPDAPLPHPQVPGGRMWYDLEDKRYSGIQASRRQLEDWLMTLPEQTQIPLERTVVVGFSQGGAMALDVGLSLPVAGLVSLSGYLHGSPRLHRNRIPSVAIAHGCQDTIVPLALARQARDTLTALKVAVQYREFDMGHEVQPMVVNFVREFLQARLGASF